MFHPDELRDPHGRWTAKGLLEHGITIKSAGRGKQGNNYNLPTQAVFHDGKRIGTVSTRIRGRDFAAHDHPAGRVISSGHASIAEAAAHIAAKHPAVKLNRSAPSAPHVSSTGRPIKVGDHVEHGGIKGRVVRLGRTANGAPHVTALKNDNQTRFGGPASSFVHVGSNKKPMSKAGVDSPSRKDMAQRRQRAARAKAINSGAGRRRVSGNKNDVPRDLSRAPIAPVNGPKPNSADAGKYITTARENVKHALFFHKRGQTEGMHTNAYYAHSSVLNAKKALPMSHPSQDHLRAAQKHLNTAMNTDKSHESALNSAARALHRAHQSLRNNKP